MDQLFTKERGAYGEDNYHFERDALVFYFDSPTSYFVKAGERIQCAVNEITEIQQSVEIFETEILPTGVLIRNQRFELQTIRTGLTKCPVCRRSGSLFYRNSDSGHYYCPTCVLHTKETPCPKHGN